MTIPLSPPPNPRMTLSERRWVGFWNALAYLTLLTVTLMALWNARLNWPAPTLPLPLSWPLRLACLAGSLLWAAWYTLFIIHYELWEDRLAWKVASFAAAVLLTFGLCWLYPSYLFLLFIFYGISFGVLPLRLAIPVVVLLPGLMAIRMVAPAGLTWVNLMSVSWVVAYGMVAILLGLWLNALLRQGRERQDMLDQLRAAQAELAQNERHEGVLAERQRLAGVIHDTLAQDLTSVVIHLEAAEQALAGHPTEAQEHIDQARRAAREGLAEARHYVWALRPELTEREPLQQAIRRVAEQWSRQAGVAAHLACEGQPCPLPPPVEVTLLRAAQEGLANVRKHAAARQVELTLTYLPGEVLLDVQDDGCGFDPASLPLQPGQEGGYGLFSLRERARELGGSCVVESEPGQGATLTIHLPIPPVSQEAT